MPRRVRVAREGDRLLTPSEREHPGVLLVDDEPDILESLRLLLKENTLRVHTATDGVQALEVLARERVDLLLTDFKMPRMDGVTLLRTAAARHPGLAMILVTAHPEPAMLARAAATPGFRGWLAKPFAPVALLERVDEALAARPA